MTKRKNIFGVSWKKLKDSPTTPCRKQEPIGADSPTKQIGSTSNMDRVMTRMMTFRDSIGTLKQVINVLLSFLILFLNRLRFQILCNFLNFKRMSIVVFDGKVDFT